MKASAKHRARVEDRDSLLHAGEAAFDRGDFEQARELAMNAVRAADGAPEGNVRASARRLLALSLLYCDRAADARRVADESVRIAQTARAHKERALAELAISEIARTTGDYLGGLHHASRAYELAVRARDVPALRTILADYGLLLSRLGDGERAREAFAEALALPSEGQPPARAFRVMFNAASMHRSAGRWEESLAVLDRAERHAREHGLRAAHFAIASARVLLYVDVGALDEARALIEEHPLEDDAPTWQRAQVTMFDALVAHAGGEKPELVERFASQGLALEGLEPVTRMSLERLRAIALHGRGKIDEAERVAIDLVGRAAKGGARAIAAQAMAIAARCARPEAALLRWLGVFALASGGVSARMEHEALSALGHEPEPIGALARTGVDVIGTRLVDRAPPALRKTMKRTLRQVEAKLAQAKQARRTETETALSDETVRAKEDLGLVGSSPPLIRAVATLARAAKSDTSIVITGETGSGKELFAQLAHRLSARASGPFVAVNCAAIPEPLLEAELFGHERGAFTGAERARPGLFVEAQGGTLFLDEVGEMSAAMQAKLLRVLEEREVRAVGGSRARKIDVRVLGATHRELSSMVAARAFREDLYYRLAAITVRVPSLRERPEDIPTIARAIVARDPTTARMRLDVPALTALAEHAWPGNVRELANVLRVAAALSEGAVIGRDELTEAITQGASRLVHAGDATRGLEETTLAALRTRHRSELRELVGRAIASADGNKLRAARALGISRQGLYRVLAEFDD